MRVIKAIRAAACLLGVFIGAALSGAVEIHGDAGTVGAAFLKIDAGCRPLGMGGAFAGLADDVNAIFWNPAGLTSIEKAELSAMQNFHFGGVNNVTFAYGARAGRAVIGIGLQGVFAQIERRSGPTEEPEETFYSGAMAVGLSVGCELSKLLSAGATCKLIYQDYDGDRTNGGAIDLGVMARLFGGRVRAGVALQNLGRVEGETDSERRIPTAIRAGGAIALQEAGLNLAAELAYPLYADPTVRIGAEKWVHNVLALRGGYIFGIKSAAENPISGLTLGVGLKAYGTEPLENVNFQFDYAYIPDRMGDSHRISFIARF